MAQDYEDVTMYTLDGDVEEQLLRAHNECTFIWSNKEGWPVGVIMSYVWRDGRFWLTASSQRARVARRAPRSASVRRGDLHRLPAAAQQGRDVEGSLHRPRRPGDEGLVLPGAVGRALNPDDPERAAAFQSFLDSPRRVVFEVTPTQRIGYDGAKLRKATEGWLAAGRE